MKSKFIIHISILMLIIIYTIRVIYVSNHSLAPEIITYNIGDEVAIENDYFDNSSEKMNGYSVTVLDAKIMPIEEFENLYNNYNNNMNAEYMYLLKVRFKNTDNSYGNNAGIDLGQYILQESSYINFIDREAYDLINDFDSIKFSLRLNSEMELIIPYHIDPFYINIKKLRKGNPQLVVSLYPHKKVIRLN